MIDLPVIRKGLKIGSINLEEKTTSINHNSLIHFTCTSNVDCCSTMKIPASDFDIDLIMQNGYELDQIIGEASPIILNPNSRIGRQQKAYILKKKPFDGTCTFLEDKLCQIHDYKPFACKIYPFALEFVNEHLVDLVIHQDQLCRSIKGVSLKDSNNKEILDKMLITLMNEVDRRGFSLDS